MKLHKGLGKSFEKKLINVVGDPLLYAPSQKLSVIHQGKVKFRWSCGEDYLYYDLASLTKILFSASLWMRLFQERRFSVNDPASKYLSWWKGAGSITLKSLLTHSAGLTWWKPYYEQIGKDLNHESAWEKLRHFLFEEKPAGDFPRAVYSDLDLFYLGFAAEEISQRELFNLWLEVKEQLGFKNIHFRKERPSSKVSSYAPTGFSSWRNRSLQGEVHDDNASALEGVAPHAGLFGGLQDLESYVMHFRTLWQGNKSKGLNPQTFKEFTQRQTPASQGDFGYLFWKPTQGASSSGKYFEESSFGHTGFTGTSIWCDPKKDMAVIFLTNRVAYEAELDQFRIYRPLVHDLACEVIL